MARLDLEENPQIHFEKEYPLEMRAAHQPCADLPANTRIYRQAGIRRGDSTHSAKYLRLSPLNVPLDEIDRDIGKKIVEPRNLHRQSVLMGRRSLKGGCRRS